MPIQNMVPLQDQNLFGDLKGNNLIFKLSCAANFFVLLPPSCLPLPHHPHTSTSGACVWVVGHFDKNVVPQATKLLMPQTTLKLSEFIHFHKRIYTVHDTWHFTKHSFTLFHMVEHGRTCQSKIWSSSRNRTCLETLREKNWFSS